MLYWMNGSDNCSHTNYLESSSVDGSGRRITYDLSSIIDRHYHGYYCQIQAIDFFGEAIYSYSGYYPNFAKTKLGSVLNITYFPHYNFYPICQSSLYLGMKVISPERQHQGICLTFLYQACTAIITHCIYIGINPCATNNGGCAHLCLLSNTDRRNYTCSCYGGTQLHQNGHDCIGKIHYLLLNLKNECMSPVTRCRLSMYVYMHMQDPR